MGLKDYIEKKKKAFEEYQAKQKAAYKVKLEKEAADLSIKAAEADEERKILSKIERSKSKRRK